MIAGKPLPNPLANWIGRDGPHEAVTAAKARFAGRECWAGFANTGDYALGSLSLWLPGEPDAAFAFVVVGNLDRPRSPEALASEIADALSGFDLRGLGMDAWNNGPLGSALNGRGVPVTAVRLGRLSLASPVRRLFEIALDDRLDGPGRVLAKEAASCAFVEERGGFAMPSPETFNGAPAIMGLLFALALAEAPAPAPNAIFTAEQEARIRQIVQEARE